MLDLLKRLQHSALELQEEKKIFRKAFVTFRASVMVDCAICLPVFLLSVLSVIGLVNQIDAEAEMYFKLCNQASIAMNVVSVTKIDVPFLIVKSENPKYDICRTVFYRPFTGESELFKKHEQKVFVFPNNGERYHFAGCSSMDNNENYKRLSLKEAEDQGYTPCKLCSPDGTDYFKK